MKLFVLTVALCAASFVVAPAAGQEPAGTAFTYQGRLTENGSLVTFDGVATDCPGCDFKFRLYDAAVDGLQVGDELPFEGGEAIAVSKGLFTATLDFGDGVFNGEARWLEIEVRCPSVQVPCQDEGVGVYTLLGRQKLEPAPYAQQSLWPWLSNPSTGDTFVTGVNVGINTSSPEHALDVIGTAKFSNDPHLLVFRDDTPGELAFDIRPSGPGFALYPLRLGRADGGIVTIPDSLGIRTETPTRTLDVAGSARVVGTFLVDRGSFGQSIEIISGEPPFTSNQIIATAAESQKKQLVFRSVHDESGSPAGDVGFRFLVGTASAPMTALTVNENATVCIDVGQSCSSDLRLKKDVTSLDGGQLAQVTALRGVQFNWRRDLPGRADVPSARQLGFIAQEVRDIVPEVVTETNDGYLAVDYGKLVPVLAEAIEELHDEVVEKDRRLEQQQAQIQRLAARLDALEARAVVAP